LLKVLIPLSGISGRSEIGRYQNQLRSKLRGIYPEGIKGAQCFSLSLISILK